MASVLDAVKYYQQSIEKHSNDEERILKCIDKLFHLDVTTQHLQETGVGRTVNALRKDPGEVGTAARSLVYKWKRMVAAEESDHEGDSRNESSMHNGNGSGKESDDNSRHHKSRQEPYERTSTKPSHTQHPQLNGHNTENKRKYQNSEEEELNFNKKKKTQNIGEDEHKKPVLIKQEKLSDSESDDDSDSSESDSDSYTSDSSCESTNNRKEIKQEKKIKKEKTESPDRNESPKIHHSNHEHQRESSSKRPQEPKNHSNHSSKSDSSRNLVETSSKSSSHSHKHKTSYEKENSSVKKHKSHNKSPDEKRESKESNRHSSSEKHKTSSHKQENNPEKHKSRSDSQSSKSDKHKNSDKESDKHRSSSQADKEQKSSSHTEKERERHKNSHPDKDSDKHKSSSERESSKHRSKESGSSSKDKSSSSSKERSKDRSSSSSKEKSSSHSEKKTSSDSKSQEKLKPDKSEERSEKKSRDKSSSSSHKSKSSGSKSKDEAPKKTKKSNSEDSEEGIDCGSGASFAEALGMMVSPTKPKKKSYKDFSPNDSFDLSPAALLAPTAKLVPLSALEISALPEISPNYKPRPPPKPMPHFTDEEALSASISSKNQRTKVYSGNKIIGKVTSLYAMCVSVLQEHIDALEYTGGVPYDILKPVIDKATPNQLFVLEHYNPYLMEDTDHLWQKNCEKYFRNKKRQEMETWREMYMRCQEEQESKLKSLTANIRMTQEAKKAPIKQTKMAYVDNFVKPPRNVARKQAIHGTAHSATASPAARVASLASGPNVLKGGAPRPPNAAPVSSTSFNKPKKAPLMQKALQFMRGRKR